MDGTPTPRRSRAWIAWVVVAVAGLLIGGSFLFRGDDKAAAQAPKNAAATPVTAGDVVRGVITQRGRYPGELDADAADVAAFYAGRLVSMHVRVGDTVKAGDVIAELDPVDAKEQIAQAQAQAKAAVAERNRANVERDAASAEVARLEPLAREKLISALEIDRQRAKANALAATVDTAAAGETEARARVRVLQKRIQESVVRAPFAGRIAERYVDPGAIVNAGARLARIVAVAPLRVRFEVPEADIPRLAVGTTLRVITTGDKEGLPAKITGIASEVSRERRVAIVEGMIENPPAGWLPGMYAEAVVDLRTIEQAIIVPATSVLSRLQPNGSVTTGVFVAGAEGTARWIPIREVTRDGDRVAVEADLPPATRVLVSGHVDLTDGGRIKLDKGPSR
ncbi:MAG: efflux RND transporter periplasmic adaptor subunit [Deltaproteobacteria bacterium]|nr:efflux RND transporter periplasmic adaptor subunit [Deltaproteobacteria bacterium]